MKGTLWERGGKNLTRLEGSEMMIAKKEEESRTFLINVFNFFLFAESPGSVTRKGLLEGAVQDHEGVRTEVIFSGPSFGPSLDLSCLDGVLAGSSFPTTHSRSQALPPPSSSPTGAAGPQCAAPGSMGSRLALGGSDGVTGRGDTSTT